MTTIRYTPDHEWLRQDEDGLVTMGITDHAQEQLGDVVYVQLPQIGQRFAAGAEAVIIESVKAAGELHLPAAGEVVDVNTGVADDPGLVNRDPQGAAWLLRVRFDQTDALLAFMDDTAYRQFAG